MNPSQPTASREVSVADAGRAAEPDSHGPVIPDHQLLVSIAAGAYGEVWLARNAVGTLRAVKIVRRDRHALIESFEREFKGLQKFEPVSRMHEGLVDILTLGLLPKGTGFYYVMELADNAAERSKIGGQRSEVRGQKPADEDHPSDLRSLTSDFLPYSPHTLRAELNSRGALPADEVIVLGLKLCSSLAYLHASGLVHRDVKPSNILFIGGEPKLADAGLVAAVDDARSLVGTAGYIAPEGPGTPQADLFALGKVLYEAAFGKDRQEFPALPADVASRPDHAQLLELNAILLKACAANPRGRYQTAEQICDDLELLQAGQSVKRRRAWQQNLTYAKKLALAASALAVVLAIVYSLALVRSHSPSFKPSPIAEANEEYRIGMTALHFLEAENAIKHFERAVKLDPKFAPAYAQMADAWISMGSAKGKQATAAAEKALQLDPNLGMAHAFFAHSKLAALDWSAAREHCTKALKLSPDSEEVLLACALMLSTMGFTNEAIANLQRAVELGQDTPSRMRLVYSGFVYQWTRQYNHAIAIYNEASWGGSKVHEQQALAYLAIGDYTNAIRFAKLTALERGEDGTNQVNAEFDALEKAFKEGGPTNYWKLKLKYESPKNSAEQWMRMATIHARLNQRKEAFDCLRQAMKEAPADFARGINRDPNLESLRTDPQFKALLNELWRKSDRGYGERRR